MDEIIKIVTERFLLRPLTEDDITDRYLGWLGDGDAKKFIVAAKKTKSLSDLRHYVLDRIGREDVLFLGIFEITTGLHIGNIKYDLVNSHLGYSIMGMLIGDPAYRGKGVAAEVISASAQWLKHNRNIKQILLGVSRDNSRAILAYKKIGFLESSSDLMQKAQPGTITMLLNFKDICMNDKIKTINADPKIYDVFLSGETVDLCAPSDDRWVLDQWYRWFNKAEITKYLPQGVYPTTLKTQKAYYDSLVSNTTRITLLIKPKQHDLFVGVTSLSSIDLVTRQCDFAMVIGERLCSGDSLFCGMETKCLMTEHAFEVLGMERINSTQVTELVLWQRWQILFGYQIEGVLRQKFRKGYTAYDVLASSCLLEDYIKIKNLRGDRLWPGKAAMFELLKKLPKETLIDEILAWLPEKQKAYFDSISFKLD